MSDPREIRMRLEREDTPTRSIFQRWKYEIFIRHIKLTLTIFASLCVFYIVSFGVVILVMGTEKWALGFVGIFICLWWIIKYIGIAIWFVVSRAYIAFLFIPAIYFIIKYFIHVDKVGLRELGSKNTYFFKITTTKDGYLLHEDRFFGLAKSPVYLDKTTVQYFKENGEERIRVEKGKKDFAYFEVDIVPLAWKGDSLYITDQETNKKFLNNKLCVTKEIRDLFAMQIKGLPPTEQEIEKNLIYETILGTADLRHQLIDAKYQLRNVILERLELVLDVALPPKGEEYLRHKRVIDKVTKPYDDLIDYGDFKREMKEISLANKKELLDEAMLYYVSEEEN